MTNRESRRKGHAGGHVVRLDYSEGWTLYLTDYRRTDDSRRGHITTEFPALAEWFEWEKDARDAAARMRHATGQPWVVTTTPADARPVASKRTVIDDGFCAAPCPDCGSHRTAKVADSLRCFRCGHAWTPAWAIYEVGPEDDDLTDEQVSWAARAAAETVFPELDDDSLDAIEAEIRSELRSVAKGVARCFVP